MKTDAIERVAFFMKMAVISQKLEAEAQDYEVNDDSTFLSFSGPGCSDMLTLGQINAFIDEVEELFKEGTNDE
jgi:hypothetical protein